jgi:hypothetical protein
VSRLSRQCGILNISQLYWPPRSFIFLLVLLGSPHISVLSFRTIFCFTNQDYCWIRLTSIAPNSLQIMECLLYFRESHLCGRNLWESRYILFLRVATLQCSQRKRYRILDMRKSVTARKIAFPRLTRRCRLRYRSWLDCRERLRSFDCVWEASASGRDCNIVTSSVYV